MDQVNDIVLILKYIFLGLFQGVTEPIPVSSSGHLIIVREILDVEIKGLSFEILVNFGSLIAVLLVYRHDIIRLIKNGIHFMISKGDETRGDFYFIVFLVIATIPTGVIGLLLEDYIGEKLSGVAVVGVTLLITGAALWIIRNLTGWKHDGDITVKDALIVGFAQSIALVPGISRSGATVVAAMLVGMSRDTALRFSFLLYIPVSLGISVLSIGDIIKDKNFEIIPNLLAFIASIIASFYALKWFINIMKKGNLKYFTFYCVVVGILVLLFLA